MDFNNPRLHETFARDPLGRFLLLWFFSKIKVLGPELSSSSTQGQVNLRSTNSSCVSNSISQNIIHEALFG